MNIRVGTPGMIATCYVVVDARVSVLTPAIEQGTPSVEIVVDKDGHEHARMRITREEALALAKLLERCAT